MKLIEAAIIISGYQYNCGGDIRPVECEVIAEEIARRLLLEISRGSSSFILELVGTLNKSLCLIHLHGEKEWWEYHWVAATGDSETTKEGFDTLKVYEPLFPIGITVRELCERLFPGQKIVCKSMMRVKSNDQLKPRHGITKMLFGS